MPVAVRSTTLTQLYTDLVYSGNDPGRGQKYLDRLLQFYDLRSLAQGSRLPLLKPDSKEAKAVASQILKSGQRGNFFWPENTHGHWPSGSIRRRR